MTHLELAQALLAALRAQAFEQTPDALQGGAPVGQHPSLDLAVVAFPHEPQDGAPVFANVLISREHPLGLVAEIAPEAGAVSNISYVADVQDGQGNSIAWLPGADWSQIPWQPFTGSGPQRFVSPYPASLLKLMILVGLGLLVDLGRSRWEGLLSHGGQRRSIADWAFDMTAASSNEATTALVAHLHAVGAIRRHAGLETHNDLHHWFWQLGLSGLRLANTRADGGWGNAAGSGVGHCQMTAWDTARLLWWLDPLAPPLPGLAADAPRLSDHSRCQILHCLREQGLHEVLSSGLLMGLPGWQPGLPARLPKRWLRPDGSARVGGSDFPADLRPATTQPELLFAHKTGNTQNYAADAGIVMGLAPARRHYLIALTSNLGSRYAQDARAATSWRLAALGAAVDGVLRAGLGP